MAFIVPEEIERYAEAHTTPPPPLLAELAAETEATLQSPQMLTGPIEGRLLEQLVFVSGARRVLELGTYSGYSSLSMAVALPPDGRIDTCEVDERHAEVARRYIARSPYADRITVHLGPALETIAHLEGEFDLESRACGESRAGRRVDAGDRRLQRSGAPGRTRRVRAAVGARRRDADPAPLAH